MKRILAWLRVLPWQAWSILAIALLGLGAILTGARFLYVSYYDQPQLSYIPTDQVWRDHLEAVVAAAKEPVGGEAKPSSVAIEVSGAVSKPGVYELSSGARTQDALLKAGGFLDGADLEYIHTSLNLAAVLQDQQKIYIPHLGEKSSVPEKPLGTVAAPGGTPSLTAEMLMEIDGIGEKRAESVLEGLPYTDRSDFDERSGLPSTLLDSVWQSFESYL